MSNTTSRRWPVAATLLLIVCVIGWLATELPRGLLTNTDELLTAERTREMLLLGRSTVHLNFEPSFAKPPLQYWLTTLTLGRILDRELAVRIWPLFFGVLTALALGWLTYLIDSKRPWLIFFSVAILLSCPLFLREVSRALLDSGVMFFTTLAIICAQLARKRAVWWLGVAIGCWLGTLQKIPFIYLVWIIILLVRLSSRAERPALRNRWLIASLIFAIALTSIWPLFQLFKYHAQLADVIGLGELTGRIRYLSKRPYLEIPVRLSTDWIGAGSLALVAPIVLLFRKEKQAATTEISILCLSVAFLVIVFNARSIRYLLPIIPCFCLLFALILQRLFEQNQRVRISATVVALVFFTTDIVEAKLIMNYRRQDSADEQSIAQMLSLLQRPGTSLALIRKHGEDRTLLPAFYLFYGNLRFPIDTRTLDEFSSNPPLPPVIVVCTVQDFVIVRDKYPSVSIQLVRGNFVCWRASRD